MLRFISRWESGGTQWNQGHVSNLGFLQSLFKTSQLCSVCWEFPNLIRQVFGYGELNLPKYLGDTLRNTYEHNQVMQDTFSIHFYHICRGQPRVGSPLQRLILQMLRDEAFDLRTYVANYVCLGEKERGKKPFSPFQFVCYCIVADGLYLVAGLCFHFDILSVLFLG